MSKSPILNDPQDLTSSEADNPGCSIEEAASKNEILDLTETCFKSCKAFDKAFLPESFWRDFEPHHDQVFDILDDNSIRYAAITAFRGFGKTTIVGQGFPLKRICYQEDPYILYISNTLEGGAEEKVAWLRWQMETNPQINKMFGALKGSYWSRKGFLTSTDIKVVPRGQGQQIRGTKHGDYRPSLIIVDDLEDRELVRSDERRKELKHWFFEDLMNSFDKDITRIVVIGTILHEDSLLLNLMEDPYWAHLDIPLFNAETLESYFPNFMTNDQILEMFESHQSRGMLDSFFREYGNLCVSPKDAVFLKEMFRDYSPADLTREQKTRRECIIIVDPAKTVKQHSAHTALVAVYFDRSDNKIFVEDIRDGLMTPTEMYDVLFQMVEEHRPLAVGVKATGLKEFIMYPIRNEMQKRGKMNFELVEIIERGGPGADSKDRRISQMAPFYQAGSVLHNRGCAGCKRLEAQLLMHPKSKRKDISDALADFIEMFDIGGRYFEPSAEDMENEFKELGMEDNLPDDWRICP